MTCFPNYSVVQEHDVLFLIEYFSVMPWISSRWLLQILTNTAHMQVDNSSSGKTLSSIQHKAKLANCASGDATSSYPCPATAVAAPKARVPAPSVSEDEDGAELIVPDSEGGASVGDNWVLPDKATDCYARRNPNGPAEGWRCYAQISFMEYLISQIAGVWYHTWYHGPRIYDIVYDFVGLWYHKFLIS